MSKTTSRKISEIDDLIRETGKDGVELLLLFKLLKTKVKQRIKRKYPTAIIEEETLNKLCIQKAHELIKLGKKNPTEKDLERLLSALREKDEKAKGTHL